MICTKYLCLKCLGLKCDEFNISICRSMVAMRDLDHTGTLGVEEFQKLWDDLETWKVPKYSTTI